MRGIWRIVGLLLVIAMAVASPGAQAMPATAGPMNPPAGCHGHGLVVPAPALPLPAKTSYQCCATGHQVALPNATFSLSCTGAQPCSLNAGEGFGLDVAPDLLAAAFVAPSDSPPVTTSLRI